MPVEAEETPAVGADALEHPVAVQKAVVEHGEDRRVAVVVLAVDPDNRHEEAPGGGAGICLRRHCLTTPITGPASRRSAAGKLVELRLRREHAPLHAVAP